MKTTRIGFIGPGNGRANDTRCGRLLQSRKAMPEARLSEGRAF